MNSKLSLWFVIALMAVAALCTPLFANPNREILLSEDFSTTTFPPTGWTIDTHAANWSRYNANNAGGTAPEVRFNWSPQFTDTSRLISPQINTSGQTSLLLDFNQMIDFYEAPFTLGVATRSGGGAWTSVWTLDPTTSVEAEERTVSINNADVGSTTFQFAFFFTGNSYNINYWYLDNVKLYTPFPWDLAITAAPGEAQLPPVSSFTPVCTVENAGLNTLTAVVSLLIYRGDDLVQSNLNYATHVMPGTTTQEVSFPAFSLIAPDEIYSFVYSVASLEDVVDGDLSNNQLTKYIETYTSDRQKVLLEIGTGGWCQYCPGAAMGADDLVDEGLDVAVVENHNGDPYATDISNGRNSYYGITGYPTAIFDGINKIVGGSNTVSMYNSYLPQYNLRHAIKTPITVGIYGTLDRDSYSLEIWIDKLARIVRPNLVLHVAITESNIVYSWQGQDHMNFVNRNMLPGLDGTPVDLMNLATTRLVVPLALTIGTGWLTENCDLVAWVQDLDTKEVIQANTVWLPALLAPPVANNDSNAPGIQTALLGNYPNPFNPQTTISYKLANPAEVSIDIFNSRGQLVRNLVDERKAAGDYQVKWDGKDKNGIRSANGIYFYKMKCGSYSATRKMLMMK